MKSFIFNADDLGLSGNTNKGIFQCFENGVVRSASLLVTGQFNVDEIKEMQNRGLSIGIHLNVSGNGRFITSQSELFGKNGKVNNAYKQKSALTESELNLAIKEFEEQVALFIKIFNEKPEHINFHHPLYEIPGLTERFIDLLKKYNLPTRWYLDMKQLYGLHPDNTEFGFYNEESLSVGNLISLLDSSPDGITEVVLHPGLYDENLDSSYKVERQKQVDVLTDKLLKKHISNNGYRIISFNEIK